MYYGVHNCTNVSIYSVYRCDEQFRYIYLKVHEQHVLLRFWIDKLEHFKLFQLIQFELTIVVFVFVNLFHWIREGNKIMIIVLFQLHEFKLQLEVRGH